MATTKVTTDNIDLSGNTGALEIPTGTSDQRPGVSNLHFLVVAGGGGTSTDSPGGGGAGGLRTSYGSQSGGNSTPESQFTFDTTGSTSYTLTIGDGGGSATDGSDSIFATITSTGGGTGAGGTNSYSAGSGGSGGGGSGGQYNNPGGTATSNQGFRGGNSGTPGGGTTYPGAGGGGAGAQGQDSVNSGGIGKDGGVGLAVNILNSTNATTALVGEIDGSDVYYAGGGGGSANGTGGTGGTGGGGNGQNLSGSDDGTDNTGGGGGGYSASGGSGVVILRYSSDFTLNKTGTLVESTGSPFTEDDEKISVFISGSGTVNFTGGSAAVEGMLRENTTTGKMEVYTGAAGWRALQQTGQDVGITPSNNFTTNLWSYQAAPNNIVTGFQPDFVWIKDYQTPSEPHISFDSVRGAGEYIQPNSNIAEVTNNTTLTSFNTTGFTLGTDTVGLVNYPGRGDYVGWSWKAGGNSNTFNKNGTGYASASAAGLTTGTITPTGSSVGTETGFSIIKYTADGVAGATIPHGLGAAPDLYIIKALDSVRNWIVGTWMIPNTQILQLDLSDAPATYDAWNSTYPDANNVTVSNANPVNASGDYIMYCFRSIPGYSQIGYYIGTDVASGNKIYTGFKPAWLLVRNISTNENWYIIDNKRSTTNPRDKVLYANTSNIQATLSAVNFLDYGFEIVTTNSGYNNKNEKYLFMAFSE